MTDNRQIKTTDEQVLELLRYIGVAVANIAEGTQELLETNAQPDICPPLLSDDGRQILTASAIESIDRDLRLHKKHFSRELEAQAIVNEISKQSLKNSRTVPVLYHPCPCLSS